MKRIYFAAMAFAAITLTSCGGAEEKVEAATEAVKEVITETTYNLDATATTLNWKGTYIVAGVEDHIHVGTVPVTEGSLIMKGDDLVAGKFSVNVAGMTNEDAGEKAALLVTHLSEPKFFNTAEFATADVKVNSMTAETMNITIMALGREFTQDIEIEKTMDGNNLNIASKFTVDFEDAMSATALNEEEGNVSSEIAFDLNLALTK